MTDETDRTITLVRMIHAPAEELFAAWTDPALLEQWQAETVEFEPFEGGAIRFESVDDEDPRVTHVVTGKIAAFEPNRKLVEEWEHKLAEGQDTIRSRLTVSFRPVSDDSTELTLVEESDSHDDPESRIFSIEAWNEALEVLADLLE